MPTDLFAEVFLHNDGFFTNQQGLQAQCKLLLPWIKWENFSESGAQSCISWTSDIL